MVVGLPVPLWTYYALLAASSWTRWHGLKQACEARACWYGRPEVGRWAVGGGGTAKCWPAGPRTRWRNASAQISILSTCLLWAAGGNCAYAPVLCCDRLCMSFAVRLDVRARTPDAVACVPRRCGMVEPGALCGASVLYGVRTPRFYLAVRSGGLDTGPRHTPDLHRALSAQIVWQPESLKRDLAARLP